MGEILYKCNCINTNQISILQVCAELAVKFPEAEFKEFEPRLKFKQRLKYGWFHWKSYSLFQDLSRRPIETGFLADLRRGSNSLNSDTGGSIILVLSNLNSSNFVFFTCHTFTLRKSVFLSTIQQIILLVSERVAYMIQKDTLKSFPWSRLHYISMFGFEICLRTKIRSTTVETSYLRRKKTFCKGRLWSLNLCEYL